MGGLFKGRLIEDPINTSHPDHSYMNEDAIKRRHYATKRFFCLPELVELIDSGEKALSLCCINSPAEGRKQLHTVAVKCLALEGQGGRQTYRDSFRRSSRTAASGQAGEAPPHRIACKPRSDGQWEVWIHSGRRGAIYHHRQESNYTTWRLAKICMRV